MSKRERGEGSIRRGGRQIRYYDAQGQRCEESVAKILGKRRSKLTPQDSERALAIRLQQLAVGTHVGAQNAKLTVKELIDDYVRDVQRRKPNHDGEAGRAAGHLRTLHTVRAASLTTARVQQWIDDMLGDDYAPATVNMGIWVLSGAYELALAATPPRVALKPKLPRLPLDNARTGFFEHPQFLKLVVALPPGLADMSQVAYAAGPRRGELEALQWEQVDRGRRTATLLHTKNGHRRVISLDGFAWPAIERRWKSRALGCAHVFHLDGQPIENYWDPWARACHRAGLTVPVEGASRLGYRPIRMFHDFRRTYARNALAAGVAPSTIMKQGGWISPSVFLRYAITDDRDLQRAAAAVHAYVGVLAGTNG